MSTIPFDHTDPDLGDLVPEGQTAVIVDGDDRVKVGVIHDPEDGPLQVKAVRLPASMIAAAEAAGHPAGVSGVVREALADWLARHAGRANEVRDAQEALAVLQRVIGHLDAA
ncbi:hypothetical protein [Paractinoplanes maris]|uniref:hypothetical protein n=1 Tax=Paractinoplanes maris TaxID=1734446 RepID=UPI0020227D77|nr:hypothetical protein [Actinoplanes maris]